MAHQSFMFLIALVGMRELKEFYLLELVLAKNAAGVFSRSTGFGAKASSPGGDANRQLVFWDRLIAIEIV